MSSARILIVEDKSIIAEGLAAILENAGYIIAGKAATGEKALDMIENEFPDVIIMDIHLAGELDGIETTELLNRERSIPVIYLTDFQDEQTIKRAKHTRPAAYLLKPYQEKDLLIAIEIAFFNASSGKEAVPGKTEKITETLFQFNDRFFIKEKYILHRVNVSDILWIEAGGAYSTLKTIEREYILTLNLRVLSLKFNHPMLFRVHRSFIVNMDKVTAIEGNMLIVEDIQDKKIPIGDNARDEVNRWFQRIK
jgi:DNA-binding LytR/AlgR family response regulator